MKILTTIEKCNKANERKVIVKLLSNKKIVNIIIEPRFEGWKLAGGTPEEQKFVSPLGEKYNNFLHGIDEEDY